MKTQTLTYGELNTLTVTQQEILVHLLNGATLRKSNLGAYAMADSAFGSFHVRFATVQMLHHRGLVAQGVDTRGRTHVVLTREGHRYASAAAEVL